MSDRATEAAEVWRSENRDVGESWLPEGHENR